MLWRARWQVPPLSGCSVGELQPGLTVKKVCLAQPALHSAKGLVNTKLIQLRTWEGNIPPTEDSLLFVKKNIIN